MKTIYLILGLSLCSCTKDWKCEVTSESDYVNSTYYVDFRGTNEEKNQYEESNSMVSDDGQSGEIVITTNCYPD